MLLSEFAFGLKMDIVKRFLTPDIAKYELCGIFIVSGLAKIVDQDTMIKMFPQLPRGFWKPCGAWEVAAALAVWFGRPDIGCMLAYAVLGGVFYAVTFLKTLEGKTQVQKTFGLMLLPGTITFLSALVLAEKVHKQPLPYSAAAAVFGIVISHLIAKRKIKM